MKLKFGKMVIHAIIIGLLIAILVLMIQGRGSSGFEPAPLSTSATSSTARNTKSIFDLKVGLDCVAGPSEKAAYYSQGLTPGGLCGSGEYVIAQERDYEITDGIGGSLLEK